MPRDRATGIAKDNTGKRPNSRCIRSPTSLGQIPLKGQTNYGSTRRTPAVAAPASLSFLLALKVHRAKFIIRNKIYYQGYMLLFKPENHYWYSLILFQISVLFLVNNLNSYTLPWIIINTVLATIFSSAAFAFEDHSTIWKSSAHATTSLDACCGSWQPNPLSPQSRYIGVSVGLPGICAPYCSCCVSGRRLAALMVWANLKLIFARREISFSFHLPPFYLLCLRFVWLSFVSFRFVWSGVLPVQRVLWVLRST